MIWAAANWRGNRQFAALPIKNIFREIFSFSVRFSAESIVHGWGRKGRWCNWTIAKLLICSMRARSRQSWSYQQNTGLFAARLQRIFWTIRMTQKNVSTTLIWVHGIRYRLKTQTRYWPISVESFAIWRLWSTTPIVVVKKSRHEKYLFLICFFKSRHEEHFCGSCFFKSGHGQ